MPLEEPSLKGMVMPADAAASPVTYALENGVASIVLNRPAVLNALDEGLAVALGAAVAAAEHDPAVRCVVLSGAGDAFMAGGDIQWMSGLLESGEAAQRARRLEDFIAAAHQPILALRRMPKPVIASVHGAVAGYGLSLMLAADLAVAATGTKFTTAYSLIGTSPDGGATYHLTALVGPKKALHLFLTGERFTAEQAAEYGLVSAVVAAEERGPHVASIAAQLAAGPTAVYGRTKRLVNRAAGDGLAAQMQAELESFRDSALAPDFAEGVRAFLEKRKPRFTGQ
jgi:2-(1,2-epoxy-1,2-dihydrophenyl)acetyl-CoA isomerase